MSSHLSFIIARVVHGEGEAFPYPVLSGEHRGLSYCLRALGSSSLFFFHYKMDS